ncbi:MAG TPA: hypothetical protein VIJ33_08200, partial [Solirubrobacteraceae bacterium]
MAESTEVALAAASIPKAAEITRAEKLVRERFLHEGEDSAVALAPGSPRRRALDHALVELKQGAKHPSTAWRREFSLLLGLERVLSDDEPKLADGTVLSAHQVDALSGTLTALLAEAQRTAANGNGRAAAVASPELLASAAILGPEGGEPPEAPTDGASSARSATETDADVEADEEDDEDLDEDDEDDEDLGPVQRAAPDEDDDEDDFEEELEEPESELEPQDVEEESDEEPQDWVDEGEEEALADQPEDPNAAKRFWFEHATGAGKTVAALGFVEASQTGGI